MVSELFGVTISGEQILAWLVGGGGLVAIGAGVKWLYDKWAKDEETALTRMQGILTRQDNELASLKKEMTAERVRSNLIEVRLARCETWIRMQPNYPQWVDQPIESVSDTDIHKALGGGQAGGS